MAIGDSAKTGSAHITTTCPVSGAGPQPNAMRVGKHVSGSGAMPGSGAESGEPSSQHPGNTPRTDGLK